MIYRLLLLLVLGVLSARAQASRPETFAIDESKPFVYIAFDHIGDRRPFLRDDVAKGLWLRLTNNCKISIRVRATVRDTKEPKGDVVIPYDVIGAFPMFTTEAMQVPRREDMPRGFPGTEGPGGAATQEIAPGDDLVFNVPSNAVNQYWYIEVRFEFVLPPRQGSPDGMTQPYGVASFTWSGIPPEYRQTAAK